MVSSGGGLSGVLCPASGGNGAGGYAGVDYRTRGRFVVGVDDLMFRRRLLQSVAREGRG